MTIKQLIDKLKYLPSDMIVTFVNNGEITEVESIKRLSGNAMVELSGTVCANNAATCIDCQYGSFNDNNPACRIYKTRLKSPTPVCNHFMPRFGKKI